MNKTLRDLIGAHGQTKRIRTLAQARAVIDAEWAEPEEAPIRWVIANQDEHRPATDSECKLLDRAAQKDDGR